MIICPLCGSKSITGCQDLINELSSYNLSLQDGEFIHQLVVDTYAAQHSNKAQKLITISFALIGLYLTYERGFSGKQVQRAHMALARKSKTWPKFGPLSFDWPITVENVLETPEGEQRNEMIRKWGESVWQVWREKYLQEVEVLVRPLFG